MPSYPEKKATRRRRAVKRRSRFANSESLSLLENTQTPRCDSPIEIQAEEPSQLLNDSPPWSKEKCNCLCQSSIHQLQKCHGQAQVQKVRFASRPLLKAWSDQSQNQVRDEKAQTTAQGEGRIVEPSSLPTFEFEFRRPTTTSCTEQLQVNSSSTTHPKHLPTGTLPPIRSASPLLVYSMIVPRLDTVMVQPPTGSSAKSAPTPIQAPVANLKEVEGEKFVTTSVKAEESLNFQAVSMAYSRSLHPPPGVPPVSLHQDFWAGRTLTPNAIFSAPSPSQYIPHQSLNSSLHDITAPLYANHPWEAYPRSTQQHSLPGQNSAQESASPDPGTLLPAVVREALLLDNDEVPSDIPKVNGAPTSNQDTPTQGIFWTTRTSASSPEDPHSDFRSVWPPGTLIKKSIPLAPPTHAITHAWTNGLPPQLSAAADQAPANAAPFISERTYGNRNSVVLPVTSPATSQATPADHPAMIVAKLPSRSLVNQRYDPAHGMFKRAMQAEEARLTEKRANELKAHLLGLKEIPGLGHDVDQISGEVLPPGRALLKPIDEPIRTSIARAAAAVETKTILVEDGDGWYGEMLPDDDWEFVEWSPLSGLLWKASGLDGLVLGSEEG